MTNKEYTLKYLFEHEDLLMEIIDCAVCKAVGLDEYCRETRDISCESTKKEWLSMEHKELPLFPIGTPLEVDDGSGVSMGYYNGFENDTHYVTTYKQFIGRRYHDGELYGVRCKANQLKKVGDSNA